MKKLLLMGMVAGLCGLSGAIGAGVVLASGRNYYLVDAVPLDTDNRGTNTYDTPVINRDWRLVSTQPTDPNGSGSVLWFQDPKGNVFRVMTRFKNNRLGVGSNIHLLHAD